MAFSPYFQRIYNGMTQEGRDSYDRFHNPGLYHGRLMAEARAASSRAYYGGLHAELRKSNPYNSLVSREYQNQPWIRSTKGATQMTAAEKKALAEHHTIDVDGLFLLNSTGSPKVDGWNLSSSLVLSEYIETYNAAVNNHDLTQAGRDKEIAKASVKWGEFLSKVETGVNDLAADIDNSLKQIKTATLEQGKASFAYPESGSKEIRDMLAGMSGTERLAFINDNATPALLYAVGTYPLDSLRKSVIDDEMMTYVTDKTLRNAEPVKMADLDVAKETLKEARLNIGQMEKGRESRETRARRNEYADQGVSLTQQCLDANALLKQR